MIRLRIEWPDENRPYIETYDSVKNIIDSFLVREGVLKPGLHGLRPPAQYGIGLITGRPLKPSTLMPLYRVFVGSANPEIAAALERLTPEDLIHHHMVPGAGIDLRAAQIYHDTPWPGLPAAKLWTATPLVLRRPGEGNLQTLPADLETLINQVMARRFGRPFHLTVRPDGFYVRQHNLHLKVVVPIKNRPDGRRVFAHGLRLPLTLIGPPDELAIAWTSGLGAHTAIGFGWLAFYREPIERRLRVGGIE